jgi:hypothetical protein
MKTTHVLTISNFNTLTNFNRLTTADDEVISPDTKSAKSIFDTSKWGFCGFWPPATISDDAVL